LTDIRAKDLKVGAQVIARSGLRRGDLTVIVGVGGIGAFLTWAAVRAGAEVWVLDISLIGSNAHVLATDLPRGLELLAARGAGWDDIASEVRTLEELVDSHRRPEPLGSTRPVTLLVDPAETGSRPATHRSSAVAASPDGG